MSLVLQGGTSCALYPHSTLRYLPPSLPTGHLVLPSFYFSKHPSYALPPCTLLLAGGSVLFSRGYSFYFSILVCLALRLSVHSAFSYAWRGVCGQEPFLQRVALLPTLLYLSLRPCPAP